MIRKSNFAVIVLFPIVFLFISCRQKSLSYVDYQTTTTPVTITQIIIKPLISEVDMPAVSVFLKKSTVRSTITGTLTKVAVVQGDVVIPGQLLFSLKTREAMALDNSAVKDSTFSFKGAINITSPGKGVISSIKYQSGDYVQEGDELAIIAEPGSIAFTLEVPVELDQYIKMNKSCTIELPDMKNITGTIAGKLPEMNLETQTIRYLIKPSSETVLPENLIGNVKIIKSTSEDAQALPKKAVLSDETQTVFWVMNLLNDSLAVKTIIQKGIETDEEVEIKQPHFQQSDRFILTGNYGLPDTARILIAQP